jgi:hypothetical protein
VQAIGRQPQRAPDGAALHYDAPSRPADPAVPPGAAACGPDRSFSEVINDVDHAGAAHVHGQWPELGVKTEASLERT